MTDPDHRLVGYMHIFFKLSRNEELAITVQNITIENFFRYLATRSGIYRFLTEEAQKSDNESSTLWSDTIQKYDC